MLITKKRIIFISTILILIAIAGIYVTYAVDETSTNEYDMALNFDLSIGTTSEMTIAAGQTKSFDIEITNPYDDTIQYGVAYSLVSPTKMPEGVTIGYLAVSKNPAEDYINSKTTKNVSIIVINDYSSNITLSFSIVNGYKNGGSLTVPSGKKIIKKKYYIRPSDFNITNILVDNIINQGIPTTGDYTMTSTCDNASYNKLTRKIKLDDFTGIQDCEFNFFTDNNHLLLNAAKVGDYVAYVGNNGCKNGETGVTGSSNAESGNSCLGENANQPPGTTDENGQYGFCYSSSYRYHVTGWRIAYIENGKVYLTSAGSPECRTRTASDANTTQIADLNSASLKYCNATYADGGSCPTDNSNTWAMGNEDFKKITNAISGTSMNLTSAYSSSNFCYNKRPLNICGYNNNLLDNGGYYWFSAYYTNDSSSSYKTYGVFWHSNYRYVSGSTNTEAYGVRPIIRLSPSVYITGGEGTSDNPYTIGI